MKIHERFWSKVDVQGPTDCWEWTAAKQPFGYGTFKKDGAMMLAHRVVIGLIGKEIPEGLFVLHHCDNPPCVNPDHLFFGTHQDNARDRDKKNRGNVAKLLPEDVACIRRCKGKITQQRLGEIFGVTQGNIGHILSGFTWVGVK